MKFVVCGNYGAENLGDEMILEGLLKTLRSIAPNSQITVLSGDPKFTADKYAVTSTKKFPAGLRTMATSLFGDFSSTRKALKGADYFVLGGGGLFGGPERFGDVVWGIQGLMSVLHKKPVIIIGQSVGRLSTSLQKFFVKNIFKKALFIGVRDIHSRDNLKTLGITSPVHIIPDLAFRSSICHVKTPRQKRILVCLRNMPALSAEFKNAIADFLKNKKGYKISFLNFQSGQNADEILSEEVISLIGKNSNVENIPYTTDFEYVSELFSSAEFVLGMRLHSIITAIKTHTPFLALNYASKVKSFLEFANLENYLLEIEELNSETLSQKFSELNEKSAAIQKHLATLEKDALKRNIEAEGLLQSKIKLP